MVVRISGFPDQIVLPEITPLVLSCTLLRHPVSQVSSITQLTRVQNYITCNKCARAHTGTAATGAGLRTACVRTCSVADTCISLYSDISKR